VLFEKNSCVDGLLPGMHGYTLIKLCGYLITMIPWRNA